MSKSRKPRTSPLRTCVGCRRVRPKQEMVRIVRSPQGEIRLDAGLKAPGRGTYLCPDEACLAAAVKRKALGRALKFEIPDEVVEELGRTLSAGARGGPDS